MGLFVIGVDVGNGNTKTRSNCFSSGVKKLPGRPPLVNRVVETTEGFYAIGSEKVTIQRTKIDDDVMRVLTMAGIAEELKKHNATVADVRLGVGVPLTSMGSEKDSIQRYYNEVRRLIYKYEDVQYSVTLLSVDVFPQGYAGIVSTMKDFNRSVLVVDIGSWTVDILPIYDYIPDQTRCKSLRSGTIGCINDINENLRQIVGQEADGTIIKDVMIHGTSDIPEEYLSVIEDGLRDYTIKLMDQIRALGFNQDLTQYVFIGGGASIIKYFLPEEERHNIRIIEDVSINAKGYEDLIHRKYGGK